MTEANDKICNFNCTCDREGCSYKHRIETLEARKKLKEIHDKVYDKEKHRETDPEGKRFKVCSFGILCNNKDCGFKHFCSYEGRVAIANVWYRKQRKVEALSLVCELEKKVNPEDKELIDKLKKFFTPKK
jgi:hypothetical protein